MSNALLTYPAEIRAIKDGEGRKITGRAAVFDELSYDLGGFRERIVPGAFAKTIRDGGTKKAYWNHNSDRVLGSTKAGTLTIEERDDGLHFEITPPSWAGEHVESIERGDVDQMSFGFRTVKDRWHKDEEGKVIRELVEVQLFEVSPVASPAYPQTDAQVRSIEVDRLREMIVKAEHGLLDDTERDELRAALADLQQRAEPHHSDEPDSSESSEHHSTEPDGEKASNAEADSKLDERISDVARFI